MVHSKCGWSIRLAFAPFSTAVLVALTLLLFAGASETRATVLGCGDIVGPGGRVTLTADIGPCDGTTNPALMVIGPVDVRMNGHTLTCSELSGGPPDGILVRRNGCPNLRWDRRTL